MSNDSESLVRVGEVNILKSAFGFVNKAAEAEYRIFLTDANI